ncbi:hypothetical protein AMEX_G618 [Astyanax mexicanus]|uniref:Uncharacterized protein n=1 Tax=Astyanax mexicanus TaxID=7994 RepID=A0A8T2MKM9_ASTMX|nr:hypothetical protein AMEX_G618 [Astyanax mexicanus]
MAQMPGFFLLVIVGIIVSTLTIILVFIIINVCISKQALKKPPNFLSFCHSLFPAHADVEEKPPPLPSRDQFLSESRSNSYEQVDTLISPMKVEIQSPSPPQPTFIQDCKIQFEEEDNKSVGESYDDVEQLNNASQSYEDVASLPDYLELDDNLPAFQHQEQFISTENCSRESMASYDDVGELDNVSEDYDDVG